MPKFRNLTKKSFVIAGAMAGAYLVILLIIFVAWPFGGGSAASDTSSSLYSTSPSAIVFDPYDEDNPIILPVMSDAEDNDGGGLFRPPARTNFIFIGLDNNLLADAIMVGTFYRDSGDIRLMSVPRDMYTRIPQHRLEEMRADGLRPPQSLKINAVRAFGGRAHGVRYLKDQLGEMLGVEFHYYVEVELAAFRRIVDAIGGVTMYIPQRLRYSDPEQNLFIDIPAGLQHLNGNMAEGVVRFRSFPTGDLMRNNMQMEFMSQLMQQTLTREAIMNDPLALAGVILNDVRTNANILDIARFLPYIGNVDVDNVSTFVMPGSGQYRNGISWFIPNAAELPDVINEVFYAEISH